jgi:hypothetical protein
LARFVKIALAVVIGLLVWLVVATAGNLLIRATVPGYAEAERTFQFTLAMLLIRLALGAACSVLAGLVCTLSARSTPAAAPAFAVALVLLFLPVHYSLWSHFPVWYHVLFLLSLAPLAFLGGWAAQQLLVRPVAPLP